MLSDRKVSPKKYKSPKGMLLTIEEAKAIQ